MCNNLKKMVGSLLMIGFDGHELTKRMQSFLLSKYIGGVILFRRNIRDLEQVQALCEQLDETNRFRDAKSPLLVAIDMEGGLVNRLEGLVPPLPSAMSRGMSGEPDVEFEFFRALSSDLRILGFNVNFAPLADLYYPHNQQLLTRAYSDEASTVIEFVRRNLAAAREAGMLSCLKHFPGLGPCLTDTHHQTGIVRKAPELFEKQDLFPFRSLIESKEIPMVMVSHALYPDIADPTMPASMSHGIMTELLRNKLSFKGVCVSDDMEMKAIVDNFTIKMAAVKSIQAGCDLLLICHSQERQTNAINGLLEAVEKGEIDTKRIKEAAARIQALRELITANRGRTTDTQSSLEQAHDLVQHILLTSIKFRNEPGESVTQCFKECTSVVFYLKGSPDFVEGVRHALSNTWQNTRHVDKTLVIRCFSENLQRDLEDSGDKKFQFPVFVGFNWSDENLGQIADITGALPHGKVFFLTGDPAEQNKLGPGPTVLVLHNHEPEAVSQAWKLLYDTFSSQPDKRVAGTSV